MNNLILRAILGGLIAVVLFFFSPASTNAQSTANYKVHWETTKLLTATFNVGWNRKIIALGPSEWKVTMSEKQSDLQISHETWAAPTTESGCYENPANCGPNNPTDWLWGTGGIGAYNTWQPSFATTSINEQSLYTNNNIRGDGPAITWEPGDNSTYAFWAQGAYGWAFGSIARNENRASIVQVGIMMPLKWKVDGYVDGL